MISATIRPARTAVLLAAIGALALATADARADRFSDRANAEAKIASGAKPAEEVLFPALANMEPMPDAPTWPLMVSWDDGWEALAEWVVAEPQQAVIQALNDIADPEDKYMLGIPYTDEGLPQEWIDAGLYVQPGPQDLLLGTRPLYLEPLYEAAKLVFIDALRLAIDGEGELALRGLGDMLWLGRILVERPSNIEKRIGLALMDLAVERALDIMFLHPEAFTATQVSTAAERFDPRELDFLKFPFPKIERLAAEQILDRAFELKGDVRPAELARILAASTIAGERPLLAFRDAALLAGATENHAGWWDMQDAIKNCFGDWEMRWVFPNRNDPLLDTPTDFQKLDPLEYPMAHAAFGPLDELTAERRKTWVRMAGAYNAFGVVAFKLKEDHWPPRLAAVEPQFVELLIDDLWNVDERFRVTARPVLDGYRFFVPIRDQKFGPREDPHPHKITLRIDTPSDPEIGVVRAEVDETQFVLYSVGEDRSDGQARSVGELGSDVLIWPAELSLAREFIEDHERFVRALKSRN